MLNQATNKELVDWVIELRRYFHKYPELSFKEFNTQKKIIDVLDSLGIENKSIANTGVLGIIGSNNKGKIIALRADVDALAIKEEKTDFNESYISNNNGIMHACGHDGHIAMLLGAAKILKEKESKLRGTIKLIFQPAEEVPPGGSIKVINEGILNNVDAIIGMHLFTNIESGKVCLKEGIMMASNCKFNLDITGKPGHHSKPESCIDPIQIASRFISTIQTDLKNHLPPTLNYVLGFGTINGGKQFNQTPSQTTVAGSYRVLDNKDRLKDVEKVIINNLDGLMKSFSTSANSPSYNLNITLGYPPLNNDSKFTKKTASVLKSTFTDVHENHTSVLASEDFANYLEKVPGTFIFLGAGNKQKGLIHGNHSNKFDIDENVLIKGTEIFYSLAIDFLNRPEEYLNN